MKNNKLIIIIMPGIFLGLDCSTQSLTGIIIDFNSGRVKYRYNINFDEELPYYQTKNGVTVLGNEKVIHSYPLMWVEALDKLFSIFKDKKIDLGSVKAISGSGQQHGTVYLNDNFEINLKDFTENKPLLIIPLNPIVDHVFKELNLPGFKAIKQKTGVYKFIINDVPLTLEKLPESGLHK